MSVTCHGCGIPLPSRRRQWCSEPCRRETLYAGTCRTCGGSTDGSNGTSGAPSECASCYATRLRADAKRRHLAALEQWVAEHGRPPSAEQWRTRTASGGDWPATANVQRTWGSWSAFIAAAGHTPLPPGRPRKRVAA